MINKFSAQKYYGVIMAENWQVCVNIDVTLKCALYCLFTIQTNFQPRNFIRKEDTYGFWVKVTLTNRNVFMFCLFQSYEFGYYCGQECICIVSHSESCNTENGACTCKQDWHGRQIYSYNALTIKGINVMTNYNIYVSCSKDSSDYIVIPIRISLKKPNTFVTFFSLFIQ